MAGKQEKREDLLVNPILQRFVPVAPMTVNQRVLGSSPRGRADNQSLKATKSGLPYSFTKDLQRKSGNPHQAMRMKINDLTYIHTRASRGQQAGVLIVPDDNSYKRWIGNSWFNS